MSSDKSVGNDLPERVHWDDEATVKAWAERLNVSSESLRAALKAVGPSVAKAKEFLHASGQ